MSTSDSDAFREQINIFSKWSETTVGIFVALYEKDSKDYEARCEEIGEEIRSRILGNKNRNLLIQFDNESLRQMYRRMYEATLRWVSEKILEQSK